MYILFGAYRFSYVNFKQFVKFTLASLIPPVKQKYRGVRKKQSSVHSKVRDVK